MKSRVVVLLAVLVGLALGLGIDRSALKHRNAQLFEGDAGCGEAYALINPWLRCEPTNNIQRKSEFSNFKVGLMQTLQQWKMEGRATHVSVYLRDLQFGPWMGINEDEAYSAASLLKLPILFAVLKQAESQPEILEQHVHLPEEIFDFTQDYGPQKSVEAGGVYTINKLLEYMIVYSDNNAKVALDAYLDVLQPDALLLLQTMEDLGFAGVYRDLDDDLNVKQIASLFRILYSASYLNKDMTQKALELLVRADFTEGIVGGVPAGTQVAHKFGEREYDDGEKQLHDCGIVYYPKNHYLLCIMTRGNDEKKLIGVIADASRMIYEEMVARNTVKE